jgi:hypothetical protein
LLYQAVLGPFRFFRQVAASDPEVLARRRLPPPESSTASASPPCSGRTLSTQRAATLTKRLSSRPPPCRSPDLARLMVDSAHVADLRPTRQFCARERSALLRPCSSVAWQAASLQPAPNPPPVQRQSFETSRQQAQAPRRRSRDPGLAMLAHTGARNIEAQARGPGPGDLALAAARAGSSRAGIWADVPSFT